MVPFGGQEAREVLEPAVLGVVFDSWCRRFMEFAVLKALRGSKYRGFLESRYRRLFGVRGADALEPMEWRIFRGLVVRRL
jgi:hypothetical protein